jgi:hypothetical protein
MKIKIVRYGAIMRSRGATNNTKCWDEEDTVNIDFEDMCFHCNLPQKEIDKMQEYLKSKLGDK